MLPRRITCLSYFSLYTVRYGKGVGLQWLRPGLSSEAGASSHPQTAAGQAIGRGLLGEDGSSNVFCL